MSADAETTISITGCLKEISGRLTDAAAVAKAAVTCAESGSEHQAVRIVLELDEVLHEASTHAADERQGAGARNRLDARKNRQPADPIPRRP
jgi:hypothetical protein